MCLAESETGKPELKICVTIWLWVLLRVILWGVKILDKCSPNRFVLSVSEITHELSSLRRGEGIEQVFKMFFVVFQTESYALVNFGYTVDRWGNYIEKVLNLFFNWLYAYLLIGYLYMPAGCCFTFFLNKAFNMAWERVVFGMRWTGGGC